MDDKSKRLARYRIRLAAMCSVCCLCFGMIGLLVFVLFRAPEGGFVVGLLCGGLYWSIGVFGSDRFALDIYDAKLVEANSSPNLYKTVRKLAVAVGVEPPLIYSLPFGPPNAYVVARTNHTLVIVLTNTLLTDLTPEEARAVLALLICRIAQADAAVCTLAATLAGLPIHVATGIAVRDFLRSKLKVNPATGVTGVEQALLTAIAPLSAFAVKWSMDPALLYEADRMAAGVSGDSAPLLAALTKIDAGRPMTWWGETPYNPATAMLFAVAPLAPLEAVRGLNPFLERMQTPFAASIPSLLERCDRLSQTGDSFPEGVSASERSPVGEGDRSARSDSTAEAFGFAAIQPDDEESAAEPDTLAATAPTGRYLSDPDEDVFSSVLADAADVTGQPDVTVEEPPTAGSGVFLANAFDADLQSPLESPAINPAAKWPAAGAETDAGLGVGKPVTAAPPYVPAAEAPRRFLSDYYDDEDGPEQTSALTAISPLDADQAPVAPR